MNQKKEKYYLDIGRASDLENKRERIFYRILEIIPGFLVWLTLIGMVLFSWLRPIWVAYFIIAFCCYWLLRSFHFSIHLVFAYKQMKKNLTIDWLNKLNHLYRQNPTKDWTKLYHLVVFPAYKEDLSLIKGSFKALTETKYPKDKLMVVLSIEEKAGEHAQTIKKAITEEFGDKFYKLLITIHPKNLAGEIPGKGANSSWGAREMKEKIIDSLNIPYKNIVVSCFDVDTQVYPQYFSCLSYHYLINDNPTRSSYQPIPVYFNNFLEAPFFSRVVSACNVFWQMMQQQRPEKITTYSSHSMPFKALVEMDFWQKNVVSEDAGIFWKAFLFYDGNYDIVPLHYCVSMDACLGDNVWQTIVNLYKQQRRWAWGSEGIPYLLFAFFKNKKIALKKKLRYAFLMLESFWAWGTNALLILCLGWLPLLLGGENFGSMMLSYNLPKMTRNLMTIAMFGMLIMIIVNARLSPLYPMIFSRQRKLVMALQWLFLPLALIFFGSIPSIDAQTRLMLGRYMGFWVTPKSRKK